MLNKQREFEDLILNQKDFENLMCECGHPNSRHSGIEKWCYVSGCKCMHFKELKK